jgi:hypothetical protein
MSIHQRYEDGPWNYEFVLYGKRHRGSTQTKNQAEASEFEAQLRRDIETAQWRSTDGASAAIQHTTMWDAAQSWLNNSASQMSDHKGNLGRVRKLFGREMLMFRGEWLEVNSERFGFSKTLQVHEVTPEVLKQLQDARETEGNSLATVEREMMLVRELLKRASDMHNPTFKLEVVPLQPQTQAAKGATDGLQRGPLDIEVIAPVAPVEPFVSEYPNFPDFSIKDAPEPLKPSRFSDADMLALFRKTSKLSQHMRRVLACRFEVCDVAKHWARIEAITPGNIEQPEFKILLASVSLSGTMLKEHYTVFDALGVAAPHASKLSTFEQVLRPLQVAVCAWTDWEPKYALPGYHANKHAAAVTAAALAAKPAISKPRRITKPIPDKTPRPVRVKPLDVPVKIAPIAVINAAPFTDIQLEAINVLRTNLCRRTLGAVTVDYGDDEGQHWAALGLESLPVGAFGEPGTLVSILTGAGVRGEAAVMGADGSAIGEGGDFSEMLKVACFAGMRTYRMMSEGALQY